MTSHPENDPNRKAGHLGALLLLTGSVLLALAAGELIVRWRGADPHPALKYRFHPRYGWTMAPGFWRSDNLQPSGFRTPAARRDPEIDSGPRLLLLGDSFTAGVEQPWSRTFAGILAAEMEAREGALASLAVGGWGTAQEYLALLEEGLPWRPDAVVLQVFPYNDVCNNGIAMAWTCSWQDHLRPYFVMTPDGLEHRWLQPVRGRLRAVSRLFGLLDRLAWRRQVGPLGKTPQEFNRLTRAFTRASARRIGLKHNGQRYSLLPPSAQPPPVQQAWEVTEALFAAVHAALDERDIPLVAIVIPSSSTFETGWREIRRGGPAGLQADYGTRRSEEAFERLGVPVVSVRRRIEAQGLVPGELFNASNRHLSAVGHRWAAQWILEAVDATAPPAERSQHTTDGAHPPDSGT